MRYTGASGLGFFQVGFLVLWAGSSTCSSALAIVASSDSILPHNPSSVYRN